jgi:hypothetical protein
MSYMDMLERKTTTNAPVVKRRTVEDERSAVAAAQDEDVSARYDWKPNPHTLALMKQRYGPCG